MSDAMCGSVVGGRAIRYTRSPPVGEESTRVLTNFSPTLVFFPTRELLRSQTERERPLGGRWRPQTPPPQDSGEETCPTLFRLGKHA